jgi:hypothetical protein
MQASGQAERHVSRQAATLKDNISTLKKGIIVLTESEEI